MPDPVTLVVYIITIVGVIWVIFFGSKTAPEMIGRLQGLKKSSKDHRVRNLIPRIIDHEQSSLRERRWPQGYTELSLAQIPLWVRHLAPIRPGSTYTKPIIITTAVSRLKPRLLVLGEPGSGKTTALIRVVLDEALPPESLPIFLPLTEYDGEDLKSFIVSQILRYSNSSNSQAQTIEMLLQAGYAILLFDGLNEVNLNEDQRARLIRELNRPNANLASNTFVITCRTHDYAGDLHDFNVVEILPLSVGSIEDCISKSLTKDRAERLLSLLDKDKDLLDICRNPLRLSMLLSTVSKNEGWDVPSNKANLYDMFIVGFLTDWEIAGKDKPRTQCKLNVHSRLAIEMAESDLTSMRTEQADQKLWEALRTESFCTSDPNIFSEIISHGLLRRENQTTAFLHHSIQEYFAARALLNKTSTADWLDIWINRPHWHDILLYYGGLISNSHTFHDFVQKLIAKKQLFLAARCIRGASRTRDPLCKELIGHIITELENQDYHVYAETAQVFGEIGETARDMLVSVLLSHKNSMVRRRVAYILGEMGHSGVVPELIQSLTFDKDSYVKIHTLRALREVGQKSALSVVRKYIKNEDPIIAGTAISATERLSQIGGSTYINRKRRQEVINQLIDMLTNDNLTFKHRSCAAETLGDLQAKKAVQPLIEYVRNVNNDYRWDAVTALGKIGDQVAADAIVEYFLEPNIGIPQIIKAIDALGKVGNLNTIKNLKDIIRSDIGHSNPTICHYTLKAIELISQRLEDSLDPINQ